MSSFLLCCCFRSITVSCVVNDVVVACCCWCMTCVVCVLILMAWCGMTWCGWWCCHWAVFLSISPHPFVFEECGKLRDSISTRQRFYCCIFWFRVQPCKSTSWMRHFQSIRVSNGKRFQCWNEQVFRFNCILNMEGHVLNSRQRRGNKKKSIFIRVNKNHREKKKWNQLLHPSAFNA